MSRKEGIRLSAAILKVHLVVPALGEDPTL